MDGFLLALVLSSIESVLYVGIPQVVIEYTKYRTHISHSVLVGTHQAGFRIQNTWDARCSHVRYVGLWLGREYGLLVI